MDKQIIYHSIDLAVAAWGMVEFGMAAPGEPPYHWDDDESLEDAIKNCLPPTGQTISNQRQQGQALLPQAQTPPNSTGGANHSNAATCHDGKEPNCDLEFSGFFTLCDMDRLAGLTIRWTDNLLSHLLVRKLREPGFTTTVLVFHHATVLAHLKKG
jgi:hypothetical protein